jgi:hypothetical protein
MATADTPRHAPAQGLALVWTDWCGLLHTRVRVDYTNSCGGGGFAGAAMYWNDGQI